MCNMVFISTDSTEDLGDLDSPNFEFSPLSEEEQLQLEQVLDHPSRWFVTGRYGGCSCHLRHVFDDPIVVHEFHEPFDWSPEDPEDVEDTAAIYDVLRRLVAEDYKADVVDLWNTETAEGFESIAVSVSAVSREEFLFFENRRLVFEP